MLFAPSASCFARNRGVDVVDAVIGRQGAALERVLSHHPLQLPVAERVAVLEPELSIEPNLDVQLR
jgi:hypothetical protein